jgi:hypothetical protein
MTPELRLEKQQHIRVVFDVATDCLKLGETELATDGLTKLQGMRDAFYKVDSDLFWYATRSVNLLIEFIHQDDTRDFNAWAVGQACTALRAAA